LVWLARVGGNPFFFSISTETVAGWFGLARTGFGTETFVSKKNWSEIDDKLVGSY
jgi:hypothetical protein